MGSDYEDTLYAVLGYGGGFLPVLAHVPQIYRVHVRKSCRDISYAYQFTFATGMTLFIFYYGYKRRYPLLIPAIVSFVMIIYLIALKTYLEVLVPRLQGSRHNNDSDLQEALLQGAWDGLGGEENKEGTGSHSSDDEFLGYARSSRPYERRVSSRILGS